MVSRKHILKFAALFFLVGLVLIPCSLKQQLKGDVYERASTSTPRSLSKTCLSINKVAGVSWNQIICKKISDNNSIGYHNYSVLIPVFRELFESVYTLYCKEKIPSHLLHCMFRI